MKCEGQAYFVDYPYTIDDLKKPHPVQNERPYRIVKTIKLAKIDYENYTTDFMADREFLELNAHLCSKGDVWNCLLIQQRGRSDGVLVVPYDLCFVESAAYFTNGKAELNGDVLHETE